MRKVIFAAFCLITALADSDGDEVVDSADICPGFDDKINSDTDGIPDDCDNCLNISNPDQQDCDGDNIGDHCDPDTPCSPDGDNDGIIDYLDNCPADANPSQENLDGDSLDDACDICPSDVSNDEDNDGVCGSVDICTGYDDNADSDSDGVPDGCDPNFKIRASDGSASDRFGFSVAIEGGTAVVGSYLDDAPINGVDSGSVYIYRFDGTNWVEMQRLTASDCAAGDGFGTSVSISGDFIVVGVWHDDDNGQDSGSAYIFQFDGIDWIEQQKLVPTDGQPVDRFGRSVAISGDVAVVGAYLDDLPVNGSDEGSAYIYRFDGTNWLEEQKLTASDGQAADWFGGAVGISDNMVVVGAYLDDDPIFGTTKSGVAYIYKYIGNDWLEYKKIIPSDISGGDMFGAKVAISGENAIISSIGDDDNGIDSGSAYIYRGFAATTPTNYEDGEDMTTDGWAAHDNFPDVATINNVYDVMKGSRVIELNGNGIMNAYSLQNDDGSAWENASQFNLDMAVNFSEHFAVIVKVETAQGLRLLTYSPVDTSGLGSKVYLNFGVGTTFADGSWQTMNRDLQVDLSSAQPGNTILSVKGIIIRGSGRLDDISLQ